MEKIPENNPGFMAQAKENYQKIGTAKSPALCDSVVTFSNVGFNHLLYKKRVPRSQKERRRRFGLLRYAKEIIERRQAKIFYREKPIGTSILHFWAFHAAVEGRNMKLVIGQINNNKKQFLSIMDDDDKKQKDPEEEGLFAVPAIS